MVENTQTQYKVYNIGNFSPVPHIEYITAIEKALGNEAQKKDHPMQLGDFPRTETDVTDLIKNLRYKPDTSVQREIEKYIEWYKTYFSREISNRN